MLPLQEKVRFSVKFIAVTGQAETTTLELALAKLQALVPTVVWVIVGVASTGLAELLPAPLPKVET